MPAKVSKPRTKKPAPTATATSTVAAPEPTPAPPAPPAQPAVEQSVESTANTVVEADWNMGTEFTTVLSSINCLRTSLTHLAGQVRDLQKRSEKELKIAQKSAKKRRVKSSNRKPSGFVKPTLITDELAVFLGRDAGSMMARTEVTREINKYIREHSLQNPENGRHILPDKKLGTLLRVGKDDTLTYFNLQKFMSPHFVKSTPAPATA